MNSSRYTVLTNAEAVVWQKLLHVSWAQMQDIFPRLSEFTGPRQRYFVRDQAKRREPNATKPAGKAMIVELTTERGVDWTFEVGGTITHGPECNCGCRKVEPEIT